MTKEEAIYVLKVNYPDPCFSDLRKAVDVAIKALEQPEPKWIPCSERLPEEDGEYLVLYYTRSKYKPYVYDVMSFANDLYKIDDYDFFDKKGQKGWFYCDREYGFCEASNGYAWMPLPPPEPYKEES